MKLSVIVSILNSHEVVRRQFLHWEKMNLPDDVEIIYMDDGSDPPLQYTGNKLKNLRIIPTNNPKGAESQASGLFADGRVGMARNMAARLAKGEYVLMTDIDYIIPKESIEAGRVLKDDKEGFRRQFGVLLEDGVATQDLMVLKQYGLLQKRIDERNIMMAPHPNNFIMRRSVFIDLDGYREDRVGNTGYPDGHDRWFKRSWMRAFNKGLYTISPTRTTLLMFPNGWYCGDVDYNPFNLFHTCSRKNDKWPPPDSIEWGKKYHDAVADKLAEEKNI
jgi:glycosyltransferase involved in cell wall biosynthesis